jgi:hypothetical protein
MLMMVDIKAQAALPTSTCATIDPNASGTFLRYNTDHESNISFNTAPARLVQSARN